MLATAATGQVHETVDACLTLVAQKIVDRIDILLLEKALGCLSQLTSNGDRLLAASHGFVLLISDHWTAEAHLLPLFSGLTCDREVQLLFGNLDAGGTEVLDRMVVDRWAVQGE